MLTNWEQRCRFFVTAIERFDEARRGDPHWLSIQFMRTMKIDLEAARLLLQGLGDHSEPQQALASFTMPTLVVCGDEDDDNGSARDLAKALPNARYQEIPGTHMSSVTKPQLGEAIAAFLAAAGPRGGNLLSLAAMCGIAGLLDLDRATPQAALEAAAQNDCCNIHHGKEQKQDDDSA